MRALITGSVVLVAFAAAAGAPSSTWQSNGDAKGDPQAAGSQGRGEWVPAPCCSLGGFEPRESFSLPDGNDPEQRVFVEVAARGCELQAQFRVIRTIDGVRRAVRTKKVVYPLALRITELVYLGNGRIAVAGLGDDQTGCRTRIEVLTLSPVAVTGVPVQLGGVRYDFEPSSVQERSIGFAPVAEDEFPCIRAMWANRALEGRAVFALAGCTGQVYSIDLETKRAKLVLSADREVGGLGPVPELLLDWLGRSGPARHAEFGDRYGLSLVGDNNVDPPDVPEYLYLWDKNRDGVLDSVEFLSVAQIQARGLWGAPVWDSSWPK